MKHNAKARKFLRERLGERGGLKRRPPFPPDPLYPWLLKPELSTLLRIGTFYFALTEESAEQVISQDSGLCRQAIIPAR